jgi:hypothetical protein
MRRCEAADAKFENTEATAAHLRSVMLVLRPSQYLSNQKVMPITLTP